MSSLGRGPPVPDGDRKPAARPKPTVPRPEQGAPKRKLKPPPVESEPIEEDPLPRHLNPLNMYGPLFAHKRKREQQSRIYAPVPPLTIGGPWDKVRPSRSCSCDGYRCLVLYCECFSSGQLCTTKCKCDDSCVNDKSFERNKAVRVAIVQNPVAFHRVLRSKRIEPTVLVGGNRERDARPTCRCKQSQCRNVRTLQRRCRHLSLILFQSYCICFKTGIVCDPTICDCVNCQNRKAVTQVGKQILTPLATLAQPLVPGVGYFSTGNLPPLSRGPDGLRKFLQTAPAPDLESLHTVEESTFSKPLSQHRAARTAHNKWQCTEILPPEEPLPVATDLVERDAALLRHTAAELRRKALALQRQRRKNGEAKGVEESKGES